MAKPEAGVLDERVDGGVRVDVVRRRLLPLLRVGDDVVQVASARPRARPGSSRSRLRRSSPAPRFVS